MHSPKHREGQAQTLQECAARLAFPNWQPGPGDWTHLYTGFDAGKPYTDVAVYRPSGGGGHTRIYYQRYVGDELMAFWTRLVNQIGK